jgi:hypothetical protein
MLYPAARRNVYGSGVLLLLVGDFRERNGERNIRGKERPCPRLPGVGVHGLALWMWMCQRTLGARAASLLRLLRPDLDPSTIRPPDRARGIPVS